MSKPKSLSELPPETVERWRKHMPPFADRLDLKELDETYRESQRIRQEAMREVSLARQQANWIKMQNQMGIAIPKRPIKHEEIYECPKCHRKEKKSKLNYMKQRGRKQIPWCPHCNLQMYPEGDERVVNPAFTIKEKYPEFLTFKEYKYVKARK